MATNLHGNVSLVHLSNAVFRTHWPAYARRTYEWLLMFAKQKFPPNSNQHCLSFPTGTALNKNSPLSNKLLSFKRLFPSSHHHPFITYPRRQCGVLTKCDRAGNITGKEMFLQLYIIDASTHTATRTFSVVLCLYFKSHNLRTMKYNI